MIYRDRHHAGMELAAHLSRYADRDDVVASPSPCRELEGEADEVVCAMTPKEFASVGTWYVNFDQTDDDEVRDLLAQTPRMIMTSLLSNLVRNQILGSFGLKRDNHHDRHTAQSRLTK
jgi:predicted phosphoribosyltransferase